MVKQGCSRRDWCCAVVLGGILSACAQAPVPPEQYTDKQWSGRLSVRIEETPVQSWVVNFDLQGDIVRGELILSGPLGQTLAQARWNPMQAELQQQGHDIQHFIHLNQLWKNLTKIDFDLGVLFLWLEGRSFAAPSGWQADTSQHGRLRLMRHALAAEPAIRLDLILQPTGSQ